MTIAAIKNRARTSMENNRAKSMLGAALFLLPVLLNGAALWLIEKAEVQYAIPGFVPLAAQAAVSVFTAVFLSALSQGREAWRIRLLCRGETSGWQILYWLSGKRRRKAFRLYFLVLIRKAAWLFPAFPGGIMIFCALRMSERDYLFLTIVSGGAVCLLTGLFFWFCMIQRYVLCNFLLAVKPEMNCRDVIRQSARLMDGKCITAVRLKISFLPWFCSCLLLLPAFYVVDFYRQSLSVFKYQIIRNCSAP